MARLAGACIVAPLVSSASGAWMLSKWEGVPFLNEWTTWYAASALGLLLVTPFLLAWTDEKIRSRELGRANWRKVFIAAGAASLGVALVFSVRQPVVLFGVFPLMLLVTWHLGLLGATSAALAVAAIATTATLRGIGPIVQLADDPTDLPAQVRALQFFLASLLFTSLPLAALFSHLRAMAQARTDFLAAMSHEIRTPMSGVLGMVDLIQQEDLPPHVRRFVDSIRVSGRHLLHVINDILDFSRLQSGRLELEETVFSIAEVVEQVRSMTTPLALERRLDLAFDIDPDLPDDVQGDPARLRQVLLNLVGNAIKFTERGSVQVSARRVPASEELRDVQVLFEVRDTGIGIPAEHQRDVFAAFTQVDNSTSRRYGGSGLGLAISQNIVRAMGGEIALDSTPGNGSTFSFDIPLSKAQPRSRAAFRPEAPVAVGSLKVLVVEDVDVNRDILGHVLTRAGNAVAFALNGQEALAHVESEHFDVILMDVQMPVMDGVEATRRIRGLQGPRSQVPIVGLTANVMAHERETYLAAGMDACLAKPIVWDELWAALREHGGGEPQLEALPAKDPAGPVLVDMQVLDNLRKLAPGAALAKLIEGSLNTAEQCVATLAAANPAEAVVAHAHKLKGTAGTFGLSRISELAAAIEAIAKEGGDAQSLVPELRKALDATRGELERQGELAARPATGDAVH
jgi:signal transduction histidine kinase/DNA-binding NarL/FixJ family response regulator